MKATKTGSTSMPAKGAPPPGKPALPGKPSRPAENSFALAKTKLLVVAPKPRALPGRAWWKTAVFYALRAPEPLRDLTARLEDLLEIQLRTRRAAEGLEYGQYSPRLHSQGQEIRLFSWPSRVIPR